MIKGLGILLAIGGAVALILGVLGLFGTVAIGLNGWALTILGVVFFFAGISLLKRRRDTDETPY